MSAGITRPLLGQWVRRRGTILHYWGQVTQEEKRSTVHWVRVRLRENWGLQQGWEHWTRRAGLVVMQPEEVVVAKLKGGLDV